MADMLQKIGGFILINEGIFVCEGKVQYIDGNGETQTTGGWSNLYKGQQEIMRPSDQGIAHGTQIQLYIDIYAGNDRTGGTYFRYGPGSNQFAQYEITGVSFESDVHYQGIVTVD